MAKKMRVIVYEGKEEWLEKQLSRSLLKSKCNGEGVIFPGGSITGFDVSDEFVEKIKEQLNG